MAVASKILIATDLDPATNKAVESGLQLARTLGAKVRLAHVLSVRGVQNLASLPPAVLDDAESSARRRLQVSVSESQMAASDIDTVVAFGSPAEAIVQSAVAFGADLVVVGSHHHHGLGHLLGSVAESVVRHCACTVLVVRLDA